MMIEAETGWKVLRTRSRQERIVERALVQKEVPVYLPRLQRMNRRKEIQAPMFPGYVFVNPSDEQMYSMNFIPGSCGLIMFRGKPGTVHARVLDSIRFIETSRMPFDVHLGLLTGSRVRVTSGPLAGVEGDLVRYKNIDRLVINASVLGQAVSIEISAYDVEGI